MPSPGESAPGVGPAPEPWPDDPRLDPELLAEGDRRNVVDRYRYWRSRRSSPTSTRAATRSTWPSRTGSTTSTSARSCATRTRSWPPRSTSSARRRWNRRGAMVTDRYQHVRHHPTLEDFVEWAGGHALPVSASTTCRARSRSSGAAAASAACCCSARRARGCRRRRASCRRRCSRSAQFGSTRSINAAVAAAIAMHEWVRRGAPEEYGRRIDPARPSTSARRAVARLDARPGPLMKRCRHRYGDAFSLRMLNERNWVMFSDPEAVKEVFTGDPQAAARGRGQRDPAADRRPAARCCCSTAPSTWPSASCCCRRSTASACARYAS